MCDPGPVSIPDGHSSFGEDSLLVSFLQECHPRLAPSLLPVNHRGPVDFALFSPTLLLERNHHDDWCLLKDDKKSELKRSKRTATDLFGDHFPEVFNRVRKRPLGRNVFFILDFVKMRIVVVDITRVDIPLIN